MSTNKGSGPLNVVVAITPVKASVTLAFASEWRIHSFTKASVFHA
ncbi:hypothetical protein HMPREF0298_0794 [Corynebacterium lipophiloflavum DSM 44291]|uniref:Uncharacterized protein n=1 Tax=Corynebacterium lipophiloflavum (strain ATCC 700352 / DSM 44291 / CCUG 37336 / JCM 10383 / DMMZ 1944) TaxID=525263 RepID=C0XQS4_CORLD|nr:hypothetical protein HMPREF0298_0794 [Corynebacterium lipophiloflavum DSM 44291]